MLNSILMLENNYTDFEDVTTVNRFIVKTNPFFNTSIYSECVLKIIALGFYFGQYAYLSEAWNWLDLFVVTSSLMNDIMDTFASG
jgi:voltage-dependent calcium channel L type alpha-1D